MRRTRSPQRTGEKGVHTRKYRLARGAFRRGLQSLSARISVGSRRRSGAFFRPLSPRAVHSLKEGGSVPRQSEKDFARRSPRLVGTCAGLARKIAAATGTDTFAAHRYGAFPIAEAIRAARDSGARDFRFLPMFPQSASSTTFSVKREVFAHRREGEIFRFRENYFDDGAYISALAALFGRFGDRSLPTFASFHSVPVSQDGKTATPRSAGRPRSCSRPPRGWPTSPPCGSRKWAGL